MHSIVVTGDVRTHLIDIPESRDWDANNCPRPDGIRNTVIMGGAFMMAQAVRDALRSRSIMEDRVAVYAPSPPPVVKPLGELFSWTLQPMGLSGPDKTLRGRLTQSSKNRVLEKFHQQEDRIKRILSRPNGKFEDFRSGSFNDALDMQLDECPDVVLFDDLDISLRYVKLTGANLPRRREELRKRVVDSAADAETKFVATLELLFDRFRRAKNAALEAGVPLMEPIILASIKGNPSDALGRERNLWWHILNDNWLRQRTVVLLDAEDLRQRGLSISTGLSWERTAQDTISQIRHSKELRDYLQFGQLIIRYGVTGALQIVQRSEKEWSYTLYFDASENDLTWTESNDGTVLGYTSVYLASFVMELQAVCSKHRGHPFLGDLAPTISAAIPQAIQRSRKLCHLGYGKCWTELEKRDENTQWRPENLFKDDVPPVLPVVTMVPPLVLRNWSILSQSAQTRIAAVAKDIVLWGEDAVLNQPSLSAPRLKAALLTHLAIQAVKQREQTAALSSLNAKQWKAVNRQAIEATLQDESVKGTRAPSRLQELIKEANGGIWKKVADIKEPNRADPEEMKSAYRRQWEDPRFNEVFTEIIRADLIDEGLSDTVATPLIKYGNPARKISVVDRREVEGFRAIEKLMRNHIQLVAEEKNERPLCVAIFGPPGAGKSLAVKRINEGFVGKKTKIIDEPFNLAQLTQVNDLENAFAEIAKLGQKRQVPIAFFDEFDSRFGDEGEHLGWLKFFLGPMEDGKFRRSSVSNSILVFAGGTSQTFAEFSLTNRSITDPQWIKFSDAKGPDFTSRLSGHLDIVGINPADPDDELFLIRRAILIRSMLSSMQGIRHAEKAAIDAQMLRAVLHVPTYRHGGRSVRMLLNLCAARDGSIVTSALPPIHQLNMLVDGKAFLDLLLG